MTRRLPRAATPHRQPRRSSRRPKHDQISAYALRAFPAKWTLTPESRNSGPASGLPPTIQDTPPPCGRCRSTAPPTTWPPRDGHAVNEYRSRPPARARRRPTALRRRASADGQCGTAIRRAGPFCPGFFEAARENRFAQTDPTLTELLVREPRAVADPPHGPTHRPLKPEQTDSPPADTPTDRLTNSRDPNEPPRRRPIARRAPGPSASGLPGAGLGRWRPPGTLGGWGKAFVAFSRFCPAPLGPPPPSLGGVPAKQPGTTIFGRGPQASGQNAASSSERSFARALVSRRETCIWEMPIWSAICDWVRLP